MSAYIHTRIKT